MIERFPRWKDDYPGPAWMQREELRNHGRGATHEIPAWLSEIMHELSLTPEEGGVNLE